MALSSSISRVSDLIRLVSSSSSRIEDFRFPYFLIGVPRRFFCAVVLLYGYFTLPKLGTDLTDVKPRGKLPPKSVFVGMPECSDDIEEFWARMALLDKPTCDEKLRFSFGDLDSEFCELIRRLLAVCASNCLSLRESGVA